MSCVQLAHTVIHVGELIYEQIGRGDADREEKKKGKAEKKKSRDGTGEESRQGKSDV